jgi:hypothetical protein
MTEYVSGGEFLIRAIAWDDTFIPEEFSKENKAIAKSVKAQPRTHAKSRRNRAPGC